MRDKHTTKTLLIVITGLLVLGGTTTGVIVHRAHNNIPTKTIATTAPAQTKGATTVQSISYSGVAGQNALDLLKTHAQVITKDSSYGPYVDSINGVRGGTNGKYWAFYVNDKLADVGAAAYVTQTGDKIEWKFE